MVLILAITAEKVTTSKKQHSLLVGIYQSWLYRELTKAVEAYVKQEDEGKFRCKTCQKLFKATSFVEKHIANKHPDLVKQLDDVMHICNDDVENSH